MEERMFDNKRLKNIRNLKGLKQVDIANALNISVNTYQLWESGKFTPNKENLIKLSLFLGCEEEDLYTYKNNDLILDKEFESKIFNNIAVKNLRIKKNLTQNELAVALGITLNTYQLWEGGKFTPNKENLIKLSLFLGCKEEDLYINKSEYKLQEIEEIKENEFDEKYLKQLRKENKETQSELAVALGITTSTVTKWERGERKPKGDKIIDIAKHYSNGENFDIILSKLMKK